MDNSSRSCSCSHCEPPDNLKKPAKDNIHEHTHEHGDNLKKIIISFALGLILLLLAEFLKIPGPAKMLLFFTAYIVAGYDVLIHSFKNILKGRIFDENFLMAIATIGAFAVGEYSEGVAVMLFYKLGEFFQEMAVNRSRRSIASLMDIRPDYANLQVNEETKKVDPESVKPGDLILVKPGEKIPLDGVIKSGNSVVDSSALTGESMPVEVYPGNKVLSGSINKTGILLVEVTKEFGESTVSKILDLVQNASSKKTEAENFITKFARVYTPAVVVAACAIALLPPLFLGFETFSVWFYRALIFLVISCPCALVISIPLGFFGGIGGASKRGILIKGGNYLEALNSVRTVVFDKTGTLTKGIFKVLEICPESGFDKETILKYGAMAESFSNHPIAASILQEYGREIDKTAISDYIEISGHGISAGIENKKILAGNIRLMNQNGISPSEKSIIGTAVHIAIDGIYAGYLLISDVVKDDSKKAISRLKELGVQKTVMLTGDNKAVALKTAAELGIDECYYELLPQDKVEKIEILEKQKAPKTKLIFVGDGINDAPVIARADIGIAMGGLGSDAAIEAADIVIMTDEPSKIAEAISIAKKTRNIVLQNIALAMIIKLAAVTLGVLGLATMWEAVIADVGVAILAILNAMRALNVRNK